MKNFKKLKIVDNVIQVKLCGDSTNIGTKIKKLNVCFTLPDLGLVAKTSRGNYTLGIFQLKKENYENLKDSLSEITKNLKDFAETPEISIDNVKYKIKFLLGGDMKFLHEMMGLNACNAKHSCLMCKMAKDEFFKNDTNEIKNLKRTSGDQISNLSKVKKQKFGVSGDAVEGYLNTPIFSFLTFDDVIFDTLHLSLRLPGKLIKLVYSELEAIDFSLLKSPSSNLEDLPYQKQFFFALDKIGIRHSYSYVKSEKTNGVDLKIRSFSGDESLLIMEHFDFENYFPTNEFPKFTKGREITQLCRLFHDIFVKVKTKFYVENADQCEKDTGNWLRLFLKLFNGRHVTPYVHLFVGHLADFIRTFGDVDIYNIQGLEKLNDLTTQQYYRATNKKYFSTYQMLVYRLRRECDECEEDGSVKPAVKRFKTKIIKNSMIEEESKKSWVQFIVNGLILKNTDINRLGSIGSFSVKVSFNNGFEVIIV